MEFITVMSRLNKICNDTTCGNCVIAKWRIESGMTNLACIEALARYPEEAEKVIIAQTKTRMDVFLEKYPNAPLFSGESVKGQATNDKRPGTCVKNLGYKENDCSKGCWVCWSKEETK